MPFGQLTLAMTMLMESQDVSVHEQLKEVGLHESEIAVYLYLLEQGISTPPQVARGTGIARTHCYGILRALRDAQLVEEQSKGRRKAYLASDPAALLRALERKREALTRVLPDLRARYTTRKNKPKIRFADGVAEVQEIYRQTLEAKEIYGIGSTAQFQRAHPEFFHEYQRLLKERGIVFYDILSHASAKTSESLRDMLGGLYDAKLLPKDYGELQTEILIWDDSVAIIVLEEPVFGTILTSTPLAATFKTLFKVMRDRL